MSIRPTSSTLLRMERIHSTYTLLLTRFVVKISARKLKTTLTDTNKFRSPERGHIISVSPFFRKFSCSSFRFHTLLTGTSKTVQ